jgi:hypothetical protein
MIFPYLDADRPKLVYKSASLPNVAKNLEHWPTGLPSGWDIIAILFSYPVGYIGHEESF